MHPPDRALVLCVDEKSQIQALERTSPLLPLRPVKGLLIALQYHHSAEEARLRELDAP